MTGHAAPIARPRRSAIVAWVLFDSAAQPFFTLVTTFVFAPYFAARVAARSGRRGRRCGAMRRPRPGSSSRFSRRCSAPSPMRTGRGSRGSRHSRCCSSPARRRSGSPHRGRSMRSTIALVAFAIGTIGAEFATVFTNAMMPDLVDEKPARPALGHGLGGRLCRRPDQPRHHARPLRRRARRPAGPSSALTPVFGLDPATLRGRPGVGAVLGDLVHGVRPAALPVHAGRAAADGRSTARSRTGLADLAATLWARCAATPMRSATSSPT